MYYERLKAESEAERGKQRNAKDEIRARNKNTKKERDRKELGILQAFKQHPGKMAHIQQDWEPVVLKKNPT